MDTGVSVIMPVRNNALYLGEALQPLCQDQHREIEVIVVDDASSDQTAQIAAAYPCRLVRLAQHEGVSAARNAGAAVASHALLMFLDSDCVAENNTVQEIRAALLKHGPGVMVGGTYSPDPVDRGFFNTFQAVYVHYTELKNPDAPDFIASHLMGIYKADFDRLTGFDPASIPLTEDNEFSHRFVQQGGRLKMVPTLLVRHRFGFNCGRSLVNAWQKTFYWSLYALARGEVLKDAGPSSTELKTAVAAVGTGIFLSPLSPWYTLAVLLGGTVLNARFYHALHLAHGPGYALIGMIYFSTLYAMTVGMAGMAALACHILRSGR